MVSIIKIIALATILFLTGCNDSDLEEQNINLQKQLDDIRKERNNLSLKLAKGEGEFFQKHKEESNKEAEKNAKNKYMIIIGTIVVFFLSFIGFSFFKRDEFNKKISDKEIAIEQLNKSIVELSQRVEERTKSIASLELKIKEMEIRAKEGSINQVVRKIDENQGHRSNLLKRIEKDLKHA